MDYGSAEPLPKGWTNGDFPPTEPIPRLLQTAGMGQQQTNGTRRSIDSSAPIPVIPVIMNKPGFGKPSPGVVISTLLASSYSDD
jgi:hypothetical protein